MNTLTHKRHRALLATAIVAIILIADQALKIWVKTNFYLGESLSVFSWFKLVFVQNNGMAFGWEIGSKLMLTLFRILTVAFLIFYILRIKDRKEARTGYLV
ncbi:MAG: signal peptidase II, partial [Muribaculaceae bacterium]|nr:signal peptidase II [Muribaculaceae bacterium]